MYQEHLEQIGLTRDQSLTYELLVKKGALPASIIARRTKIPRTLVYVVLSQLQELGLVTKNEEKGTVTTFAATHPFKLQSLAQEKLENAERAKQSVDGVLATLISDFNVTNGSPGVRILNDITGIKELYKDILNEKQPVRLIRSPHDKRFPELKKLVNAHIQEQAHLGITSRVITPIRDTDITKALAEDKKVLRERRILKSDHFKPEAQMLIYANKVAFTAYNESIITTIIENKDIHTTCSLLFEYIWETVSPPSA